MPLKYKSFQNDQFKTRTDVFEFHTQFKVMKLQLSIQRNYKILYFNVGI